MTIHKHIFKIKNITQRDEYITIYYQCKECNYTTYLWAKEKNIYLGYHQYKLNRQHNLNKMYKTIQKLKSVLKSYLN